MKTPTANPYLEQFKWLKRNLELQLEDIEFEKQGKQIALYFDTANVQPAVLGLRAYYDGKHFLENRFKSRETIVDCLLASGLLGRFSMLPPHLSEFYRKVESQFDASISRKWDSEALKFLKDAGLLEEANELLKQSNEEEVQAIIRRMTGREIKRLAGDEVRAAQLWFNAVNCLLPWQRRLKLWLENGYFVLGGSTFNYSDLISSDRFHDLKDQLDSQRPVTTVNNFVDAAAIAYLLHLTAELNAGRSKLVPRFYIPPRDTTFQAAIEKLELDNELVCLTDGVTKPGSTIFRDRDYFVFRLTFRPLQGAEASDASEPTAHINHEANLWRLHEKVSNSIDETRDLSDEQIRQYAEGLDGKDEGKSLPDLIRDLKRISFIEKNWFRTKMAKDLLEIIEQMRQVQAVVENQRHLYENERFRNVVLEELKGKNKELDESLEEFRWISTLWDPLYRGAELLKKRRRMLDEAEQGDLFRDLGLLRYGFPQETHKVIKQILGNLCSGQADLTREAIQKTIRSYASSRRAPGKQTSRLIIATAVLTAARLNEELLDLLSYVRQQTPLPHYSIKVVYAELLFRAMEQNENVEALAEADALVQELEDDYSNVPSVKARPHLAVGLAYLYYRSWRIRHGLADWYGSPDEQSGEVCRRVEARSLIEKSIERSREAYAGLGDDNLSKKVYALNQMLYYSVEGCMSVSFEEHRSLARTLFNYRFLPRVWQYRFDDTLARYYLRLFRDAADAESKAGYIRVAKQHAEAANSRAGGDEEVKTFLMYLEHVELDFIRSANS